MHENQYVVDDLKKDDTWRMFNILAEFVEGFDVMPQVYPAVTI
ncbi:MAG: TIGR00730 family Rossman fold protein, partial [Deltaproteobacteria bacterium]|nr:TIGR00730 family Rossman fold protein [Deltaproteobacteria bacterium]